MTNKERTSNFLKVLAAFIYLSLTIGTVKTALDSKPDTFFTAVSVALFVCTFVLFVRFLRKIANKP